MLEKRDDITFFMDFLNSLILLKIKSRAKMSSIYALTKNQSVDDFTLNL